MATEYIELGVSAVDSQLGEGLAFNDVVLVHSRGDVLHGQFLKMCADALDLHHLDYVAIEEEDWRSSDGIDDSYSDLPTFSGTVIYTFKNGNTIPKDELRELIAGHRRHVQRNRQVGHKQGLILCLLNRTDPVGKARVTAKQHIEFAETTRGMQVIVRNDHSEKLRVRITGSVKNLKIIPIKEKESQ